MLIKRIGLWTAGSSLVAIALLTAQPLYAQAASDTERIEKLERAVELLAKQNAELKAEIKSLKSKPTSRARASASAVAVEGKTNTEVTSDGKTYVEKSVPELHGGEKWKLFPAITELELFGDLRLRYEYRGGRYPGNDPNHPNDWYEEERERYRLRLGLRGTVLDDWFFGLRFETSSSARSTNVTMGGDAGNGNGPFNKGNDGIAVGQAYLGYKGFPGVTLTGGRFAIPFVKTLLVWDDDINVEGLAEQWKRTFTFGREAPSSESFSKDGKAVAPSPSEPFLTLDVFANFGQFVYDDSNPTNPIGPRPTQVQPIGGETQLIPDTNAFLLGWQIGAKFDFPHILYVQLAPALYNYTGNGKDFSIHFSGQPPAPSPSPAPTPNQTGINSLLVFDIPAEIGWKVGKIPMRIFGDFATNFDADDRATAAGFPSKGGDRYAYQIGLGIGQLKKKHDWQISAWWQHQDQFALDPNLIDSDLFDARLNMEGVAVRAGYMLADAIVLNLTYGYAWRIDDSLGTGGTGDIPINPLDQYQLFQADLSVNF
jgi:hypothetical protein